MVFVTGDLESVAGGLPGHVEGFAELSEGGPCGVGSEERSAGFAFRFGFDAYGGGEPGEKQRQVTVRCPFFISWHGRST